MLLLATLCLAATPASAQHITKAAVDRILRPAEGIADSSTKRIPGGMPGAAGLFAGKPWWAVLQMCFEHRGGAGRPANAPAPSLDAASDRGRRFFTQRAAGLFADESGLASTEEAMLPVSGWGSDMAAAMNAAAANGSWSSAEFEDACRIFGAQAARGV